MLKHNKKTNAGIVFQQLLATTTRLAASNHVNEAKFVMSIIKKHFSPKTALGKERKLIESLTSQQSKSKEECVQIFEETLREAATIDPKQLEREKQSLITSIKKNLGDSLYNLKVEGYKEMASAQILFNEARNGFRFTTPQERVQAKNTLIESMVVNVSENKEEVPPISKAVLKVAVKKFNNKYSKMLNEDQQDVLRAYLNYQTTKNSSELENVLKEKVSKLYVSMDLLKEDENCSEFAEQLTEVKKKVGEFDCKNVTEDSIYEVMRYFDLVEDLDKISEGEGE